LHAKGFVQPRQRTIVADAPLAVEWETVWAAALALARRLEEPEPEAGYRITKRVVHMDDKIEHILQLLTDRGRIEFMAVVEPWGTRMHAVVSLLACLELAKRSHVRLRQSSAFGPLWIFPQELSSHAA
jgi:chromatin segregation and condensation protein Rec8/ScpA/Scc1 (kleisin family)